MSGIVPGIIALPSQESVPVQIGIAQLDESPLYSFNFGPEALKTNKLDVVIANIDPISVAEMILHKDAVKYFDLTKINDGVYELKLPGAASLTVARSAGKNNIFVRVSVKKWTIQSAPEGADIYTDTHPGRSVGKTNSTVDVTKSISSYALL